MSELDINQPLFLDLQSLSSRTADEEPEGTAGPYSMRLGEINGSPYAVRVEYLQRNQDNGESQPVQLYLEGDSWDDLADKIVTDLGMLGRLALVRALGYRC